MRIIAGKFKGRRLSAPTWPALRPTSDKLRETLFNVIAPRIEGARFLDGYAGTGGVGLEALSRGAAHVTFVERDPRACRLIAENIERCGVSGGYTIVRGALAEAARRSKGELGAFDLVFLDPPYDDPDIEAAIRIALGWLTPSGLLIVEHAAREAIGEASGARLTRDLRSGDSALAFFERLVGR
jgi:16S rRNA (guanine966-N2)-methyltransferase